MAQAHLYRQFSDEELLAGIRAGREDCFTALYERYFPRVYAFTSRRLRNRSDAEEVVQEVFTAVFRSVAAFRGDSQLLTWIFGIARNTINGHVRRARAQEERLAALDGEEVHPADTLASCTPEEQLALQRCAGIIQEQLGSVAGWQLDVFRLRHEEDLSIREIARRTQRSGDAVRSSLYRVKRLLVEAVEAHRLGEGGARSGGWSAV